MYVHLTKLFCVQLRVYYFSSIHVSYFGSIRVSYFSSIRVYYFSSIYHTQMVAPEPYHQNQNPAEWRYRTIKSWTNTVMNRSGAPANCWLLCLIYV